MARFMLPTLRIFSHMANMASDLLPGDITGGILKSTWIDLGHSAALLIATTIKSAKGESVFTKLKPLWHSRRGFLFETGSPLGG